MSTTQRMAAAYDSRMGELVAIRRLEKEAQRRVAFTVKWMPTL